MPPITTLDPYRLGPDVAGMSPPDLMMAVVPDNENSASASQANMMFAAGASHGTFVLVDANQALSIFYKVKQELSAQADHIASEGASALISLWSLKSRVVLLAADIDGGFAQHALNRCLSGLDVPRISRMRLDAAALVDDGALPSDLRDALSFLAS